MRNVKGFSLLSFLLYLMLFTMIVFLSCQIIISLIIPAFSSMRKCQSIIKLHIATDLFVRDIHAIQNNSWKKTASHELVWQAKECDIGWCFYENNLIRNMGTYDKEWKNKKSSIVACGIKQGSFNFEKDHLNNIISIQLCFTPIVAQKNPIVCYVATK